MAMEAKSGGLAVRRPLQPRDSNVASPVVAAALAEKAQKAKAKVRTRLGSAAPASPPSVKTYALGENRVEVKEVSSLAEELEKARERRGRMRAARDLTERVLEEREEALRREAREWERRGDEQRRHVAATSRRRPSDVDNRELRRRQTRVALEQRPDGRDRLAVMATLAPVPSDHTGANNCLLIRSDV